MKLCQVGAGEKQRFLFTETQQVVVCCGMAVCVP